jgi:type I restriction enzyme S subunit
MTREWRKTTLGEVADFLSGGTPSKDNASYWGGTIPWVSAKDMKRFVLEDTLDHLTEEGARNGTKLVPERTVLLLTRGMTLLNDVPISTARRPMTFNQDVKALRPKKGVNADFLPYLILGHKQRLLDLVDLAGHGTGRLNTDELKSLDILLPPEFEQLAIADILGKLDDKIELNRRMNETLEAIASAVFESWFVDFDPVHAKAKGRQPFGMDAATSALFPDSFDDSALGKIPSGWKVDEIRTRASNIQYGLTRSAATDPVGPRFLRITDIQGGRADWSRVPFCPVSDEEHRKYRICPGDILVARTGASTGENIYIIDAPDAVFASYLVRIQFADLSLARVAGQFMRSIAYFDHVAGAIGGSAQPNASAQVLASAPLTFPPIAVAKAFLQLVDPLDRHRVENSRQNQTLISIRDTLLPKLISGEIRILNAKKLVEAST